jgi:hypothetical protein
MKLQLVEWHRETFAVHLQRDVGMSLPARAELVRGIVSGPFGVYPGTAWSTGHQSNGKKRYTLVHMASQLVQLTLPREGLCRTAAEELADCDIAWESAWVLGLVGPGIEQARDVILRWKRWGEK